MHSYFGLGDEPFRSAQRQTQFLPLMSVASWWGHIFSRQSTAQQRNYKLVPDVEHEKKQFAGLLKQLNSSTVPLPVALHQFCTRHSSPTPTPASTCSALRFTAGLPSSLLIISILLLFYTRVTWPSKVAAHVIVNKNSYLWFQQQFENTI